VRRRQDDAVGHVPLPAAVVDEDCARDHRRRHHTRVALDYRVDAVRDEHLERGALRRLGERVGVLAHVERAVDPLPTLVVADGLGDRHVDLGECAGERRTPVSAGAEEDALIRVADVGLPLEVLAVEPGQVHQDLPRG
jgi:hypothetical protein